MKDDLSFRPVALATGEDMEFLYRLYASTREEEMAATGWSKEQQESFLRVQFNLQHNDYTRTYQDASFSIILSGDIPIGRLYVDRRPAEIRILDLSLLPQYRGRGTGSCILKDLIAEAEAAKLPLSFHVERNNRARLLYERLGFTIKADIGSHFLMEKS